MSVKKEKVTVVGEQETRTVESSPTFSSTLVPITEVNEGDNVRSVEKFTFLDFTLLISFCAVLAI